jgi:flagellar export protein FliJ
MNPDPLLALVRLRRLAVDEARRVLADCLRIETEAAGRIRAIDIAISQETEIASALEGDDQVVEEYAWWLRQAQQDRAAAEAGLNAASQRVHEARSVLGASRAAVEAVETLIAERAAEARQEMLRQEQRDIDEMGRRRQ